MVDRTQRKLREFCLLVEIAIVASDHSRRSWAIAHGLCPATVCNVLDNRAGYSPTLRTMVRIARAAKIDIAFASAVARERMSA